MKKTILAVPVLGLLALFSVPMASAQGQGNDIVIQSRVFNDAPDSVFDSLKALPVVALADTRVNAPSGFANRHVWRVANGPNVEDIMVLGIDDFFDISFDLVLLATPISPRKEAGIIVSTDIAGEGQFIVNTDAHEVVAFGGPFPFFKFEDMAYNSGDRITLRLHYFLDESDGLRKIEYVANGESSGPLEITNLEQGIPGQFIVGAYLQTVNDPANPNNHAVAVFDNIQWNGTPLGQ